MTSEDLEKEKFMVRKAVQGIATLFKILNVSTEDGIRACELIIQYVKEHQHSKD